MSIDTQSLDTTISAIGWVLGLSCVLVAGSVVGFTTWWARALTSPSLGKLLGRTTIALVGIGGLVVGAVLIAIGAEVTAGTPFGPASGGTVVYAYLMGALLATFEIGRTHDLLREHAERTDSRLSHGLSVLALATTCGTLLLSALIAFAAFVVTLNMIAYTAGWTPP